ncbi:Protein ROS1 [Abeliophyllum distichum]|uniref:Protein ROS1 n=1 Tax=Abeliophyllum distichum TaxID=126358 RepID=A0ABD1R264_9LAMI
MESRRGNLTTQLKDVEIGCSWIPATPAKPDSTPHKQICTDWQGTESIEANWLESERLTRGNVTQANQFEPGRLPGGIPQETRAQNVAACCDSASYFYLDGGFNTWQAREDAKSQVHGDDLCMYNNFPINAAEICRSKVSFGSLMALAHSAGAKAEVENASNQTDFIATSSSFTPNFQSPTECSQFTKSQEYSDLTNIISLLGGNFEDEFNGISDIPEDGSSCPSRLSFDLNSQPRITSSQFAPITLEKTTRADDRQKFTAPNLSVDELPREKNLQENTVIGFEVKGLHQKKEWHQLDVDQLCAAMSTQLKECDKPDKRGTEDTNLSKTPQQKPRKKKHRPKVMIEGQPKRTPKARAENPSSPQETTTGKREYIRRKGVSISCQANITDQNTKPPGSAETTPGKRKYMRKRKVNKPAPTPSEDTTSKTTEKKSVRHTRNSCKRSLKFNCEDQLRDERCKYSLSSYYDIKLQAQNFCGDDQSRSSIQCGQGIVATEKIEVCTAYDLARSINLPRPERCTPNHSPHTKTDQLSDKLIHADPSVCTRGKCQIVFSDVTCDKEENTIQMTMNSDGQLTPKSPNDSNCSSSAYLNLERRARDLKRQHVDATIEAEPCSRNVTGSCYNSSQAYSAISSQSAHSNDGTPEMHFPAIHKKKRTEKETKSETSSIESTLTASKNRMKHWRYPSKDSCSKLLTLQTNKGSTIAECNANNLLVNNPSINDTRNEVQSSECLLSLGPTEGTARVHNLASQLEMHKLPASPCKGATTSSFIQIQGPDILNQPHTCMEALVADTRATMTTKKRSKRYLHVSSAVQNTRSHHEFIIKSNGPPLAITRTFVSPVDEIVEQFNQLDLNAVGKQVPARKHNALTAYHVNYQEQHALVQHQRSGAVIAFGSSFNQVRRKIPRPRVDLDDETGRVWKLLLEDINSEGIDGTDKEKAKWWEEERRVFRGRANSFIARMHLVQGDRRFSPWKGSVVDSVIGVFLTQNVSDHLSSSAFMSLAARFPLESTNNLTQSREEGTSFTIKEPKVSVLDPVDASKWDEEALKKPTWGEDSQVLQNFEYNEIREVTNDVKSSKNSFDGIIQKDNLCGQLSAFSKIGLDMFSEYAVNKSMSFVGHERDVDDTLSSQNSMISSQNSVDSLIARISEVTKSWSPSNSEAEPTALGKPSSFCGSTSFVKLLEMAGNVCVYNENMASSNNNQIEVNQIGEIKSQTQFQENNFKMQEASNLPVFRRTLTDVTGSNSNIDNSRHSEHKEVDSNMNDPGYRSSKTVSRPKAKGGTNGKERQNQVDWDSLRKQTQPFSPKRERTSNTMDSVDWDAVRCSDVNEIAQTIKERGMNNKLAERIKDFLNRLVRDHGSIDLEWLKDVPPDKAKEYLLSVRGLGLKSVECVRLLTLHHLAFPVDTNVGRIAVRLGWVPLQPLPESLQLHLLELYPVLESIQKYLWPRLCKLDQRTLYELHYQMITFGKVFCTKSKPNCNACPMRGECRHFASAFASARLALPAPEEKSIVGVTEHKAADQNPVKISNLLQLPSPEAIQSEAQFGVHNSEAIIEVSATPGPIIEVLTTTEPIIEVPATPEPDQNQVLECDIEDSYSEDPDEIPTIQLNMKEFTQNLQEIMQKKTELQEGDMSKALVALTPEAASIPMPKLKNASRLRTEHQVYELPDSHPLLEGMDKREPDDSSPYLLAIWTPGETADSIRPPERQCSSPELGKLCMDETCFACNSTREVNSQTVRGTLLIPCRTAMRGSFPLNGTYFQVNEVFSDHESSLNPIDVPRNWLWNLPRRTVYFGTSIPTIFKGLSTEGIQYCFWRGILYVKPHFHLNRFHCTCVYAKTRDNY